MKTVLILIIFCFVSFSGYGQLALSLKAGINISDMVVRNSASRYSSGYKSGTSFHVGVFTKFKLSERFNLIPELQFIQKKSSIDQASDSKIKLSYIELPCMFSYQLLHWLAAEAGLSIAFKVGDNTYTKYFNSIDAGVNAGLRLSLDNNWSFLTRYYYGLVTVDKTYWTAGPVGSGDMMRLYNQNLQFAVTYFLE
jgi:lipopolysaccharide assembly outer membrane protein LptD (OstA)